MASISSSGDGSHRPMIPSRSRQTCTLLVSVSKHTTAVGRPSAASSSSLSERVLREKTIMSLSSKSSTSGEMVKGPCSNGTAGALCGRAKTCTVSPCGRSSTRGSSYMMSDSHETCFSDVFSSCLGDVSSSDSSA